jgi:putative ABC transport system permease protein
MFNLENAIQAWLKLFRKHKAFSHGNIREMELHLRDNIDDLIAAGHDEQKAFELAVKEFGEIPSMAKEEFRSQKPKAGPFDLSIFSSYIRVAIRGFTKQPFFTFLNTVGLAVGMAGGLLIALFVRDELGFDRMFADADRIYRVNVDNRTNGEYTEYASAPGPMAAVLLQDCPQVEMVTRLRRVTGGSVLMRKPETTLNIKESNVIGADSSFLRVFGIDLLEGDPNTCLTRPNNIVLTRAAARRHFGDGKALGQSLVLNDDETYVVTGVLDDFPKNSFIRNHSVFISMPSYEDYETPAWNTWYFPTFVRLKPHVRVEDFQNFLNTVKERYLIPWAAARVPGLTVESSRAADAKSGNFMKFTNTALTDIHLYSGDRRGELSPNSDIQSVYIMALIGFFLVLLASVNFMNLSTAHSLTRAKEVGIRKTMGSTRLGLIRQFLTESSLITMCSLALAILIAGLVIPLFNDLANKTISLPFSNPSFWLLVISAAFLLGIVSGSYPAFFLSRFVPAKVLKGSATNPEGGMIRNSLVVFQFVISVFLIVGTIVVFQQVNYIQKKDLGFRKDQVLVVNDLQAVGRQMDSFKEEVGRMNQVERVSLSSYLPTPSTRNGETFFTEGDLEMGRRLENALIIQKWGIDYDYVRALNLEIIAGRNFDRKFGTDSLGLLVNESVTAMLGVKPEEAIGQRISDDFARPDKENMKYYTIIGVVKNFHFESLRNEIGGVSLFLEPTATRMMVKLNAGDFRSTLEAIEKTWHKVAPGQPFSYYFMDDSFNDVYQSELRLGRIFVTFTMLSIFIACLGLFGLAAFNAEKRRKEIGIKKVLGASVRLITYQLSFDFLKLVAIAILVSLPLSWYAMNKWLEDFSYRITVEWWVFALAALLAVVISILTVSYQAIKAAIVNPVSSLRSE